MNKITYEEFIDLVHDTHDKYLFVWRYGQTLMNVLHGVDPKKYNELVSTKFDCFYDDGVVGATLDKLEKEWI